MKIKSLRWALAVLTCAGLSGMAIADDDEKKDKPEGKKERPERPERPKREGGGDRPGGERGGFFKMMDKNGDGKVTKKEFKAFHMKRLDEMFARLDENGDEEITEKEAAAAMRGRRPGGGDGAERRGPRPDGEGGKEGGRRGPRPE